MAVCGDNINEGDEVHTETFEDADRHRFDNCRSCDVADDLRNGHRQRCKDECRREASSAGGRTSDMSYITRFRCVSCGTTHPADRWQQECHCGGSLFAEYDFEKIKNSVRRSDLEGRSRNVWRYHELLPIGSLTHSLTLGEGSTPVLHLSRTGKSLGLSSLFVKDDGRNPTGTFKDRGAAVGTAAAREFGIKDIVVPTIGSAGSAWAAYGAAAGVRVHVSMPSGMPPMFEKTCALYGADVELFDGDFSAEARVRHEEALERGWASAATLREPYRLEGKKTLLFEMAEHFGWRAPDVVVCPTGGGVAAVAVWKAYQELLALGWLEPKPMRLVAVQATGVAPIVKAWEAKQTTIEQWPRITTKVPGFMASKPKGGALCLKALAESSGAAIAIDDPLMFEMAARLAREEGLNISPEGAAAIVAAGELRKSGFIQPNENVVTINTATGLRYGNFWG